MASLREMLTSLFSPSAAHAELIPTDPRAKSLLQEALISPTPAGEATRRLHARPEQVKLSTQFGPLEKLANFAVPMLGTTTGTGIGPGIARTLNLTDPLRARIALNPEFLTPRNLAEKQTLRERAIRTLGHESGHQLLNTLIPNRNFSKPFEEAVVDSFAGIAPDLDSLSAKEKAEFPRALSRLGQLSRTR